MRRAVISPGVLNKPNKRIRGIGGNIPSEIKRRIDTSSIMKEMRSGNGVLYQQ
jgi:hypothetical protein